MDTVDNITKVYTVLRSRNIWIRVLIHVQYSKIMDTVDNITKLVQVLRSRIMWMLLPKVHVLTCCTVLKTVDNINNVLSTNQITD
jgi:hypothetical protein